MKFLKKALIATAATGLMASSAMAGTTTLRIGTHMGQNDPYGVLYTEMFKNIESMSGGSLKFEVFWSSSIVKATEHFDAAMNGIIDCDMTGAGYMTGKNPAFQFVADILGGYASPYNQLEWFHSEEGGQAAQSLYDKYDMQLIGFLVPDLESLTSTRPIRGIDDLKGWKFRSPPGMQTKIFEKLGAKPIVIDFSEIFTALETKMIDGADASIISKNIGLGLYDLGKYTTYPGFHSMPSEHLACRKDVWNKLSAGQRAIIKTAYDAMSLKAVTSFRNKNAEAADELRAKGITVSRWSKEDIDKFRAVAVGEWDAFATTPEAKALVASHRKHLKKVGALK